MVLIRRQIEQAIKDTQIEFSGELRGDHLLFTLGKTIQDFSNISQAIDPYNPSSVSRAYKKVLTNWDKFILKPSQLILCSTQEHLRLGSKYCALLSTLSHLARIGLMSNLTSCFIDPGFAGYITLELCNFSPFPILLRERMPMSKLVIISTGEMTNKKNYIANNLYGSDVNLKSRFHEEFSIEKEVKD